jgi:hypothetical protein
LVEREEIKSNDKEVAELLDCSTKTLGRYLEDITMLYENIIRVKRGKGHSYELVDVSHIFGKILCTSDDLAWLRELVHKWDSSILGKLYTKSSKDRGIVFYKNSPFEELAHERHREIFTEAQSAVKDKKYRTIVFNKNGKRSVRDAICIKLIFMDQNWYLAIVDREKGFRIMRMFFIEDIGKSSIKTIPEIDLEEYDTFIENMQNPMTAYGVPKMKAHCLVASERAEYFRNGIKKFLDSQTFVKEHQDGSVEFTLDYTHSLEIIPFIQRWIPYIKILSPQTLADELHEDLEKYLKW